MRYEHPVRGQFDVSIHATPAKVCDAALRATGPRSVLRFNPRSTVEVLRHKMAATLPPDVLVFQSTQHRRSAATTSWSRARTSECTFQSTQHRRSAATVNL